MRRATFVSYIESFFQSLRPTEFRDLQGVGRPPLVDQEVDVGVIKADGRREEGQAIVFGNFATSLGKGCNCIAELSLRLGFVTKGGMGLREAGLCFPTESCRSHAVSNN